MKVNSKKIIKRVVNEKDDIESLGNALVYLSNNFDLTINDPRVYRDYLVNVYQIIHCLKFDDSITWWGLNLLINLQNQSVTNDNMIARELIRRYVEFRNKAFEYVDADKLETMIDSLPSYNDDHFSMEFQNAKKDNGSYEFWDAVLNMKAISDQTDLGLNVNYKQKIKTSTKVEL